MRLSEAIRLGSLAIQNPQAANSSFCAIGMAAGAIGRRSDHGTTLLISSDPNCAVIAEMWPWAAADSYKWHTGDIAYALSPLGRLAKMFDEKVSPEEHEPTMTIEALCDVVAGWEREAESLGINVEQVSLAAEPTEPASPTQSIQKELAVATPRGGE